MMTVPAVQTSELYPIANDPEANRLIEGLATPERDERFNFVLRRPLTMVEKEILSARSRAILPHLAGAKYSKIAKAVLNLFTGLGGTSANEEDAEVIAAQYANVLSGLPQWAIDRACMRFARGEVEASEVGAKTLDKSFRPASSHLRIIADKIARPYYSEAKRIEMTLRGTVAKAEITPEERARTGAKIAEYLKTRKLETEAVDLHAEQDRTAKSAELTKTLILAEYQSAGIKPVVGADGVTLCSLSLMRSLGYTVQEIGDERVLVAPAKESAK
jgi:hypothetical protein